MKVFLTTLIIIILAIVFCVGILIAKTAKKQPKEQKNEENINTEPDDFEPETIEMTVKVMDCTCSAKVIGVKYPKAVNEFIIPFQTTEGKLFNLPVPHECYDGFEQGQVGKLTLVNGELYGFELQ